MIGWRCPSCGLGHIFATCADVMPFDEWAAASPVERANGFLRVQEESLDRRGLLAGRRIHVEPRKGLR